MSGAATHGARPGRRIMHSGTFPGSEHARCALPEYAHVDFFPDYAHQAIPALNVCSECVVRLPCLDAALEVPSQDDHGILGGLTAMHRNRLRGQLR